MVTELSISNRDQGTSGKGQGASTPSKSDDVRDMSKQLPPYVSERLDNQISWYAKKAAYNKLRFRICQLIVIVASAVIPIINLGIPLTDSVSPNAPYVALGITAILGAVITIVAALSQMDAYFETWVLYRTTAEALKRERFLYINNAADYSGLTEEVKNKLLVERIEAMLSSENSKFLSLQQHARQQSEQQLNELLQQQRELNKQQRAELLELREFREKYEHSGIISDGKREVELVRTSLAGIKFPTNKQNMQTYVEQNKAKIANADSVTIAIGKLPSKEYANIQEILNEVQ
jgi:Protein of unknown function (DUF4231)/Protein of unknown function (DUF2795)